MEGFLSSFEPLALSFVAECPISLPRLSGINFVPGEA
jgi:hypothetical protein